METVNIGTPREEFDKMTEDNTAIYEFIDGAICMSPRPNFRHQKIMLALGSKLYNYFKGKPFMPFTEVELEICEDVIIPDISVFCDLENTDIQRSKEPPVMVIEILSPSNTSYEIEGKKLRYKAHGIKEMWIVNPKYKTVVQCNLESNTDITYAGSSTFASIAFDDLKIELDDVFM